MGATTVFGLSITLPAKYKINGDRPHLSDCLVYRLPFARLCVLQSIWQFLAEVVPPLLQAAT